MNEPTLFDMSEIQPTGQVVQATERIKLRLKRTAEDIIEIGKELIFIKSKLKHGQFLPWIEHHFEMNVKSAERFIRVAERFASDPKFDKFTHLKPSVLYELAAPSMPDEVIQYVSAKTDAGQVVSIKEVQELKKQIKLRCEIETSLKQELSDLEAKQVELKAEVERLQAASVEPVIKEIEIIKEVQVIPDGYASVEQAIEAKQNELKALQKRLIDMSDVENKAQDMFEKRKKTVHAIRQIIGRLRVALGEAKTCAVKIDLKFVSDNDIAELDKVISGINEIYREITAGRNTASKPNQKPDLAHNSMKAVQIVSI